MSQPALAGVNAGGVAGGAVSGGPIAGDLATFQQIAAAFALAADEFVKATSAETLERLLALRRRAVETLLALPYPVGASLAEPLVAILVSCNKSGLRSFPRSATEDALFVRSRQALVSASAERVTAAALAAGLMTWHPFELETLPDLTAIPRELRSAWLSLLLELPPAFARHGDADRFAHYLGGLSDLIGRYLRATSDPITELAQAFLASVAYMQGYFNEINLRPMMRMRGAIIEHILALSRMALDELRVVAPAHERPRIGFIVLSASDGTETTALGAHMERLNRNRFDVRLYSFHAPSGRMGALCHAAAETYVGLPQSIPAAVARLRKEGLDMAVFCTNVTAGAHGLTQVAAHRVAPIQVSTCASPVTTGLRNMDIMLSGALNETPDAADHYTEHLALLPGALNCYPFKYTMEGLTPPDSVARAVHNIPDDAVVFFSGANFYKMLPELSELWFRVLALVPNSYLMLMPFNPNWSSNYPTVSFNARLAAQAAAAGVDVARIRLHPPVPSIVHLHRVMEMADIYLDAFPFSGACSLYDPLAVGLPIVARGGAVCRSRHSTAILQEAGLGDWVVSDAESYVERAVALGRDATRRAAERARVDAHRRAGLKLDDTVEFAARLMPLFDRLLSDWNRRIESLRALTPAALAQRIAALMPIAAQELGLFTDRDLLTQVIVPYLRHGGSRRLIDVGACVGEMSKPFLAEGWQAVLFEPDPRCQATLAALAERHPGQVRIEKAAATGDRDGTVPFHIAGSAGLSGMSRSPFAADLATVEVPAVALTSYITRNGLGDVDFLKIDAEGHDLAILDGVDFSRIAPRLVMVEFGDQFAGQDRAAIEAALARMKSRGYRAAVVCLRAFGDMTQQQWETGLQAIGIDAVPALPTGAALFGNILFFRDDDRVFVPSLCEWLEQLEDRKRRGLSPLR